MRLIHATTLSAVLMSVATLAMADCTYPKKPGQAPDGSKASKDEMITAMQGIKKFDADVKDYQTCLDGEREQMVKALGSTASPEAIKRINDIQVQKANVAANEAMEAADAFNVQLRAYKNRP